MFVARDKELETLRSALNSDASQFIAVYGRRRVGKTVLVREAFGDHFTFAHAGVANGSLADQLPAFSASLKEANQKTRGQGICALAFSYERNRSTRKGACGPRPITGCNSCKM